MRKIFQRWLLVFVAVAFVLAVAISYCIQTNMSAGTADTLMQQRINDAKTRIDDFIDQSAQTRAIIDGLLLDKARAISLLVAADPHIVYDDDALRGVVESLGIDEVVVTDAEGIVIASIPQENVGYDMADSEQSRAFLGALAHPDFKLVQAFQTKGLGTEDVKYAGVARIDELGLVQVGYYGDRMNDVIDVVSASQILDDLAVGQNGSLYLIDGDTVASASDQDAIGRTAAAVGIVDEAIEARSGGRVVEIDGEQCRVLSDFYKSYAIVAALPDSEVYLNRNLSLTTMIVFNFAIFLLVFVLVSVLVQKVVINGISKANRSLSKIIAGDLDERVNVRENPEFAALSDGINSTVEALKGHIAAEASRIDADLTLASAIQLGNLRTDFPVFTDRSEFDVHAHMIPAREVGGDFYDLFMPDDRHLVVVIADVSGKGIPAAMFMMEAKSYISTLALGESSLDEVFSKVNEKLCANNGLDLFVTAFIASIDLESGNFEYVNAGHNPPVVVRADGTAFFLKEKPCFVLGGMGGIRYRTQEGSLQPGEALVLYTDGVTEALDEHTALYGEQRLLSFLSGKQSVSPKSIVEGLEEDVAGYRGAAEQADDITILSVAYYGRKQAGENEPGACEGGFERTIEGKPMEDDLLNAVATVTVEASETQLDIVLEFLDSQLAANGFSPKVRNQIAMAAEEVFVNIANYAYAEAQQNNGAGSAVVAIRFDDVEQEAVIDFYDAGVPYDPLSAGDPDITLPAEERDPGGLGVYMTKQLMDGVAYLHEKGKNHLTLRKKKQA